MDERVPITLLVDDAAPGVDLYYHYIRQIELSDLVDPVLAFGPRRERLREHIPVQLVQRFAALVARFGVRGKLSVVPYPAGLGSIAEHIQGVSAAELYAFLDVVRHQLAACFDITPEILTHTRKLDLDSLALEPMSEAEWSRTCSAAELGVYLRHAVELLRAVGLAPTGITSPMDFGAGNESAYREAIAWALAPEDGLCWYFLHETAGLGVRLSGTRVTGKGRDLTCVHIPATMPDHLMELYNLPVGVATRNIIADRYITADGRAGQIPAQLRQGTDVVSLLVHWSALYLNGHYEGVLILEEVLARIQRHLGHRVIWMTPKEIARTVERETQIDTAGFVY